MKIYLGTDHAGLALKDKVKEVLLEKGYAVEDCGAHTFDKNDDYPDFIGKAAQAVSKDAGSMGIVFGGSGQGEAIVANKYPGVRCSLFYTPVVPPVATDISGKVSEDPFEMLRLTREHNNANMLSLGARFLTPDDAIKAVLTFLESPFSNDERHVRRIEKVKKIEGQG
ncbi:MAG: RpiB/LacA/LacB family sugar-phosphate isomerase [Candidatus Levybacteria bacterium]|nr:RpiB/LacA/LacB family sugar-phosphate isomerase [Candidatus Levybacteria bacterium]